MQYNAIQCCATVTLLDSTFQHVDLLLFIECVLWVIILHLFLSFQTISYFKIYITISIGSILASLLYNIASQWAGARARRRLHQEAVYGLLRVPISFFDCNSIGKILNRFSADMGVIDKVEISHLTRFGNIRSYNRRWDNRIFTMNILEIEWQDRMRSS